MPAFDLLIEKVAAAGVPKEDIVPAFYPPEVRAHNGFGVG